MLLTDHTSRILHLCNGGLLPETGKEREAKKKQKDRDTQRERDREERMAWWRLGERL